MFRKARSSRIRMPLQLKFWCFVETSFTKLRLCLHKQSLQCFVIELGITLIFHTKNSKIHPDEQEPLLSWNTKIAPVVLQTMLPGCGYSSIRPVFECFDFASAHFEADSEI